MARAKSPCVSVGNTAPIVPVRFVARALAAPWGTHPRCLTTEATRARSSSETVSGLFMALETVAVDTPATRATSRRPTLRVDERFEAFALIFSRVAVNWFVPARSGSIHTVADRCHVQPLHRGTACVELRPSRPPLFALPESLLRP